MKDIEEKVEKGKSEEYNPEHSSNLLQKDIAVVHQMKEGKDQDINTNQKNTAKKRNGAEATQVRVQRKMIRISLPWKLLVTLM